MLKWILCYILMSLFNFWVISWGGAKKIEGWLSFFAIGWFALDWKAEQIRLFVLISWFFLTLTFIYGLFNEAFRTEYFFY